MHQQPPLKSPGYNTFSFLLLSVNRKRWTKFNSSDISDLESSTCTAHLLKLLYLHYILHKMLK